MSNNIDSVPVSPNVQPQGAIPSFSIKTKISQFCKEFFVKLGDIFGSAHTFCSTVILSISQKICDSFTKVSEVFLNFIRRSSKPNAKVAELESISHDPLSPSQPISESAPFKSSSSSSHDSLILPAFVAPAEMHVSLSNATDATPSAFRPLTDIPVSSNPTAVIPLLSGAPAVNELSIINNIEQQLESIDKKIQEIESKTPKIKSIKSPIIRSETEKANRIEEIDKLWYDIVYIRNQLQSIQQRSPINKTENKNSHLPALTDRVNEQFILMSQLRNSSSSELRNV